MTFFDSTLLIVLAMLFLVVTVVVAQLTRSAAAVCAVQAGYLGTLVALGRLNARLTGKGVALQVSSEPGISPSPARVASQGRWRVLRRNGN
jgi:hypothetical protein